MAMKKCKECGAEISSSAKVCPNCGKKQGLSGCLIAIIIVAVIIIVAIVGGSSNNDNSTTNNSQNNSESIEYISVTVDELDEALENNAAAAKEKYNEQYVEITGRLGTIDSDLAYISLLSTTDEWDILGIHCSIKTEEQKDIVKTLTKDDTIVVKGQITDVGEVLGYYLDIIEITK